jgi:FkbM family methyltransferase
MDIGSKKFWKLVFSLVYVKNRMWNNFQHWLYTIIHHEDPIIDIHNYTMKLDLTDQGISKDLLFIRNREFFSIQYVKSTVKEEDVVIDIGANIGYYALIEAPQCKIVYAIEPVSVNYQRLKTNISLNNMKIETIQCAVGSFNGHDDIFINKGCNWSSFTTCDNVDTIGHEQVEIHTLDTLIRDFEIPQPTFVRMDVEGYESEIIKGASNTLKLPNLKLFIEFHPEFLMPINDRDEMINTLKANGFVIKKIFFEPESWNYKSMQFLNWVGKKLGYIEYGEHNPTYDELIRILDAGGNSEVFLEKQL